MSTVRATITLDEGLYAQANEVAGNLDLSRSGLIAIALREYLERRRSAQMLAALNAAYADDLDEDEDRLLRAGSAALRSLAEGDDRA